MPKTGMGGTASSSLPYIAIAALAVVALGTGLFLRNKKAN